MSILVGDIGGTNLRLAAFQSGKLSSIVSVRNASVGHWSEPILEFANAVLSRPSV